MFSLAMAVPSVATRRGRAGRAPRTRGSSRLRLVLAVAAAAAAATAAAEGAGGEASGEASAAAAARLAAAAAAASPSSDVDWSQYPEHLVPKDWEKKEQERQAIREAEKAYVEKVQEENRRAAFKLTGRRSVDSDPQVEAFLRAAGSNDLDKVQELLEDGVGVNDVGAKMMDTALHRAAHPGHLRVVQHLLKEGANASLTNAAGYTPLLLAIRSRSANSFEVARTLLVGGANPWITNSNGNNALHWAAHLGKADVMQWLLEEDNVPVNAPNDDGKTPLHFAAERAKHVVVKQLVEFQATDLDAVESQFGHSALMLAADRGNAEVVRILLKAGADNSIQSFRGNRTAVDLASEGGSQGHRQAQYILQGRDPHTGEKLQEL